MGDPNEQPPTIDYNDVINVLNDVYITNTTLPASIRALNENFTYPKVIMLTKNIQLIPDNINIINEIYDMNVLNYYDLSGKPVSYDVYIQNVTVIIYTTKFLVPISQTYSYLIAQRVEQNPLDIFAGDSVAFNFKVYSDTQIITVTYVSFNDVLSRFGSFFSVFSLIFGMFSNFYNDFFFKQTIVNSIFSFTKYEKSNKSISNNKEKYEQTPNNKESEKSKDNFKKSDILILESNLMPNNAGNPNNSSKDDEIKEIKEIEERKNKNNKLKCLRSPESGFTLVTPAKVEITTSKESSNVGFFKLPQSQPRNSGSPFFKTKLNNDNGKTIIPSTNSINNNNPNSNYRLGSNNNSQDQRSRINEIQINNFQSEVDRNSQIELNLENTGKKTDNFNNKENYASENNNIMNDEGSVNCKYESNSERVLDLKPQLVKRSNRVQFEVTASDLFLFIVCCNCCIKKNTKEVFNRAWELIKNQLDIKNIINNQFELFFLKKVLLTKVENSAFKFAFEDLCVDEIDETKEYLNQLEDNNKGNETTNDVYMELKEKSKNDFLVRKVEKAGSYKIFGQN